MTNCCEASLTPSNENPLKHNNVLIILSLLNALFFGLHLTGDIDFGMEKGGREILVGVPILTVYLSEPSGSANGSPATSFAERRCSRHRSVTPIPLIASTIGLRPCPLSASAPSINSIADPDLSAIQSKQ